MRRTGALAASWTAPAVEAFYEALFNAAPTFATTTSFVMQEGTSKIVFKGSFAVTPFFPPTITSGTIKGFAVYADGVKMSEASGYSLDYHALIDGLAAVKADPANSVQALLRPYLLGSHDRERLRRK